MRVVAHRPAHSLARVVDDDVQPRQRLVEHRAEPLEAPRVAQVHGVHVKPSFPNLEVRLRRVPPVRVRGEARGGQQRRAGSEQLEPYFEADLDPGAGQERHLAGQVRGQTAHLPVHRRARLAKLRVEVVQLREPSFARVALPRRVQGIGRIGRAAVVVRDEVTTRGAGRRRVGVVLRARRRGGSGAAAAAVSSALVFFHGHARRLAILGRGRPEETARRRRPPRLVLDRAVGHLREVRHTPTPGGAVDAVREKTSDRVEGGDRTAAAAVLRQRREVLDAPETETRVVAVDLVLVRLLGRARLGLLAQLSLTRALEDLALPRGVTLHQRLERAPERSEPRLLLVRFRVRGEGPDGLHQPQQHGVVRQVEALHECIVPGLRRRRDVGHRARQRASGGVRGRRRLDTFSSRVS